MREGNHVGDRVYVKDATFVWLPATIVAVEKDRVLVQLDLSSDWQDTTEGAQSTNVSKKQEERWVPKDDYRDRILPMQNTVGEQSTRDCADLPHLHEAAILYQIKERHWSQHPYTRVGDIVVAVNPCEWIKDLYSVHQGILYAKNFVWQFDESSVTKSLSNNAKNIDHPITSTSFGSIYNKLGVEPHIYEVSALAYRGMFLNRKGQTILVSGESGAGKTETVKIVLHHLATLETASLLVDNDEWPTNDMIEHVVESSPVFEAFGNAKTVRNHNSSRFGKMTRLHFGFQSNGMCGLRGSTCQTYLLETNRVVSPAPGERNFHIFYQLLAAPASTKVELLGKEWESATPADFMYLNGAPTTNQDADLWTQTQRALDFFEWRDDKLKSLCQALAAIMRLGNIIFTEDSDSDGCHASPEAIALAAQVLGLPAEVLDHALRHKTIHTAGERVDAKLTPMSAKDALDTLVRKIYDVVFQEILKSVNSQTKDKSFEDKDGIINLLDIYGFEAFETNRFEQLCINYANEMLHKKYIDDNFQRFKDEYEREGIELFDFSLVDNAEVLDLLQGHEGIIYMVNEECVLPNGNSENFVQKMKRVQKGHPRLLGGDLMLKTHFGIKHFAAPVVYDASQFVERNMHRLPSELLHVISKTSNPMISDFFTSVLRAASDRLNESKAEGAPIAGRKRASKKKAVLERFRVDLQCLMESMKDTEARYIRCVKPNETLTPGKVNHSTIMRQLECAGLVTAIDLSRETYPNKLSLAMVEERFDCLLSHFDRDLLQEMPLHDKVQYMLSKLYAPLLEVYRNCEFTMPYACGKTKVYFRSGALEMLESLRYDYYSERATVIQAYSRRWLAKQRMNRAWRGLIVMQACSKGYLDKTRFQTMKFLAVCLQSIFKGRRERRAYLVYRNTAVFLQIRWRFIEGSRRRSRELAASTVIIYFFRKVIHRTRYLRLKTQCTKVQSLVRGAFVRKRFQYVVQTCMLLQTFCRRVVATKKRKARKRAARTIGKFGRRCTQHKQIHRATIILQSFVRRFIIANRVMYLEAKKAQTDQAASVISNFFLFSTQRIKFIKQYVATIKVQSFFRMAWAKTKFTTMYSACVAVQSFCRMTRERIRFITIYMATLKLQSFIRMAVKRSKYTSHLRMPITGVLSADDSEIYTTATSDSKDPLNSKNLSIPQDPSTGILRQWMVGAFRDEQDSVSSTSTKHNPLIDSPRGRDKRLDSSVSLPSVTVESETSSCASSVQAPESDQVPAHVDLQRSDERDKDLIIRKLRFELEDMKEQEKILRDEIAAVVDLAKDHEEVVGEEFEDRIQAYEDEVVQLKESLRRSEAEKEKVMQAVEVLKNEQVRQLEGYQRHAHLAQESHKEYIRKVSKVLDEANNARKQETTRILAEVDALRQTKEEEIRTLKSEIKSLRSSVVSTEGGPDKSGPGLAGSTDLKAELRQLEKAIMAALKPDRVAVVVERAQRRPWSKEAFIDEKVSLRVGQYVSRLVQIAEADDSTINGKK